MEVTVLVDGRPRIISGITEKTTCRELITAIAMFRSQPGTYSLILMRDSFNDGSGSVEPLFIPPDACIMNVLRKWRHQVTSRPTLKFPAAGCLVLILQQPAPLSSNGAFAKRRRAILHMETREQAARLRVVTRLAKQLDAENRQLLMEAESYGDETIPPSKSLLADEVLRVSQEIKELEAAGLPDLLMQQRETERSLRQAIETFRERKEAVQQQIDEFEHQYVEASNMLNIKNGHAESNGDIAYTNVDPTVGSAPAQSFTSPVWV